MPLVLDKEKDKFSFIVWKVNEGLSFFLDKYDICRNEKREIKNFTDSRLLEWWASRYLLYLLEKKSDRSCVLKDKYGKPYFENCKKFISLSHSQEYIAAVISDKVVGIDIQKYSQKVEIVKNKFLSLYELKLVKGLKDLNTMWTIKEAVYKAYGKRKLSFKDNIIIEKYERDDFLIHSEVLIVKNNIGLKYKVVSNTIDDAVFSIAYLKKNNNY